MKKILSLLLICLSLVSFAQNNEEPIENVSQNELKINAFNLIAFEYIDITYERLLNEESSLGLGVLVALDSEVYGLGDTRRKFSLTPFYRQFFGKKYAKGFFVEAFGMLHSSEDEIYFENFDSQGNFIGSEYREEDFTDFALGISVGGKFVTKRGFLAEIYLGIGRDLLGNSPNEVVGRGGISLGYRF